MLMRVHARYENVFDNQPTAKQLPKAADAARDTVQSMLDASLTIMSKQMAETASAMKTMIQRQGIVKPSPTKFDGDAAQFPVFEQRVHNWLEDKGFEEKEKITYLLGFVSGEAREAIEHCEIEEKGFTKAMEILKEQFGHPSKIVSARLKRFTEGPSINRGDKSALTKLRNHLRACIEELKHDRKYSHEKNASTNIDRVVDRLPPHLQVEWAKRVPKMRDKMEYGPDLGHILTFVEEQVKIMSDPQFGHIMTRSKATLAFPTTKKGKTSNLPTKDSYQNHRRDMSTLATDFDVKTDRKPAEGSVACPCCNGRHLLKDCHTFVKKTLDDRWGLVKRMRLCHLCLQEGHMKSQCKFKDACQCKASYTHHGLLHRQQITKRLPQGQIQNSDRPPDNSKLTKGSRRKKHTQHSSKENVG
jgi:hypothetical protein